jgi:hypothetical protein
MGRRAQLSNSNPLWPAPVHSSRARHYVVNTDLTLEDDSPSKATDLAECDLTLGTAPDDIEVGLL